MVKFPILTPRDTLQLNFTARLNGTEAITIPASPQVTSQVAIWQNPAMIHLLAFTFSKSELFFLTLFKSISILVNYPWYIYSHAAHNSV